MAIGITKLAKRTKHAWGVWWLTRKYYKSLTGKTLKYCNPKDINEKSIWLTRYWQNPLKAICADKYLIKGYLKRKGLGHLVVPLIAVYDRAEDIDFAELPNQFVLKCNHGCAMNIVCLDKDHLNIEETKAQLNKWLAMDWGRVAYEVYYSDIPRKIICEQLLSETAPLEYQVWCINGHAESILVCRKNFDGTYDSWSYSLEWERLYDRITETKEPAERPQNLEQIIQYAQILAEPFPLLRADFYEVDGKIYVAEMTITPGGHILDSYKEDFVKRLGDELRLPHQKWEHPNLKDIKRDQLYVERFVEDMRCLANEIGMKTAEIDDPSGMSFMNRGTVVDLAVLIKYAIENSSMLGNKWNQPNHKMIYLRRGVRPCRHDLISTIDYEALSNDKYRIIGAKTGSGGGVYNQVMGVAYNDAIYVTIVANAHSEEQRTNEMSALLAYMTGEKSGKDLNDELHNESCLLLGKIQDGEIKTMFAQNQNQKFPLLSTMKILSLLLVEKYYEYLPSVVRIKDYETMWEAPDWLARKSIAKTEDLIYAMLLPSSNISAFAFARIIGSKLCNRI